MANPDDENTKKKLRAAARDIEKAAADIRKDLGSRGDDGAERGAGQYEDETDNVPEFDIPCKL